MPNAVQIIVNADDLGATYKVNDVTFGLIAQGKVTSTTMLANGPCIDDAYQRISGCDSASFGVHLNITEHQPLNPTEEIRPLLNEDGRFAGYGRVRSVARDKGLANAVFLEFCAQIEKCKSAGVDISHIDSHHHVHLVPWIFPILKRVQRKFNIGRVRISKNLYSPRESVSNQLRIKKSAYNFLLRNYIKTSTTAGFADLCTFYECATSSVLKHKNIEVMVHPGLIAYEGNQEETELLRSPWESELRFPVELINYHNLPLR